NNEAFQKALSVMVNQRAVAGSQDSFGSSYRYDPATNTWVSKLGPLPQAAQTASDQATIRRNTTDQRQAELASQQALLRAAQAGPGYDTAIRNLQNFRPTSANELSGLLQQQATAAARQTYDPIEQDTVREFARTGTAAGPVLAKLGQGEADNLRKSLIDSRIAAITNAGQINQQKQGTLENAATTAGNLANPTLQLSGLAPNNPNAAMASAIADRAKTGAVAPAYGATGVNQATNQADTAAKGAIASVPASDVGLSQLTEVGKQLGSYFGPKGGGISDLSKIADLIKPAQDNSGTWDLGDQSGQFYTE
ncbi:MAG TPA: hypothetical protein VGN34_07930, partial [Ktedonobacteraceae bacterium]